jgi:hypothetical protein
VTAGNGRVGEGGRDGASIAVGVEWRQAEAAQHVLETRVVPESIAADTDAHGAQPRILDVAHAFMSQRNVSSGLPMAAYIMPSSNGETYSVARAFQTR